MFLDIARFEFRYLLHNPLLWVTSALTFVIIFVSMSISGFELGSGGILLENAAYATLKNYLVISVLFMFVTASFVADVIIRDDQSGFGPIIRATRITKFDYLFGRFLGAFAVAAACLLMVPLAVGIGTLMPWADPESIGPNRISDHLYGYFLVGLPNIFISSALLFALATFTRSMMATYLGVIILTSGFFMKDALTGGPDIQTVIAIVEPFGSRALTDITRYWTVAERNSDLPNFTGILLYNRLFWVTISLVLLWFTYTTFRFAENGIMNRKLKKQKVVDQISQEIPKHFEKEILPLPNHGLQAKRALLWMRTKFESKQVIISPAFLILMIWGIGNTINVLLTQRDPEGRTSYPTTLSLIPDLLGAFDVILLIIVIYYAGELVWRERDRRINEIIDATPIPNWGYVVPKTLAMGLVIVATLFTTVLAAIILQLSWGHTNIEIGKYLLWYVLPMSWDMLLMAALAIFVQAVSPSKGIGWGIMLLLLIAQQMNSFITHNLLLYGESPYIWLSDMNGAGSFWIGSWIFRIYWGAFAVLLLVASHLLWRRGVEVRLRPRLGRSRKRLSGATAGVAGAAFFIFLVTGTFAYYNTNILNNYKTDTEINAGKAEFEKKYWKYKDLPQPTITHVTLDVALYPEERRALTKGRFVLTNLTEVPVNEVHVLLHDRNLTLTHAVLEGGSLVKNDTKYDYRVYKLDTPMAPREKRILSFELRRWHRGFLNHNPNWSMLENGIFLSNNELMPAIGMGYSGILQDPGTRKEFGLPEELPVPGLEDTTAAVHPALGGGWATADITISTSAEQTPIAPGKKVSDIVREGRRTARFVPESPILTWFSVQSARYEEKHLEHDGIDLAIYYHKEHPWNVDLMLDALAASIDYYEENFGPYQFDHVRIVEFPGYNAEAFAGTIPYSETLGFTADFTAQDEFNHLTYIISHELAHQYWGHQVVGAALQGAPLLSETVAQYAALMVAKRSQGEDKIRRWLKYELDRYLRGRTNAAGSEPPLTQVINQDYVTYSKGALAMYLLQERIGEDAMNRALKSLLEKYKFKGPRYPRSVDLIEALRAEAATAEEQKLITDLFQKVTLYDLKVIQPTVTCRRDGKWDVKVPIKTHKFYVDDTGTEKETSLNDRIEVGLFTAHPGDVNFETSDVIMLERHLVQSGQKIIHLISDKKPAYAGIDPYNFYIDRNPGDNVEGVVE